MYCLPSLMKPVSLCFSTRFCKWNFATNQVPYCDIGSSCLQLIQAQFSKMGGRSCDAKAFSTAEAEQEGTSGTAAFGLKEATEDEEPIAFKSRHQTNRKGKNRIDLKQLASGSERAEK